MPYPNVLQNLQALYNLWPDDHQLKRYIEDYQKTLKMQEHETTHAKYGKGTSQGALSGVSPEFVTYDMSDEYINELRNMEKENAQLAYEREMNEKLLMEKLNEPLPEWEDRESEPGVIEPMLQLYTLDGSKTGNATVVSIQISVDHDEYDIDYQTHVTVITDAGNIMRLSPGEVFEYFQLGNCVLNEYPHPEAESIIESYFGY